MRSQYLEDIDDEEGAKTQEGPGDLCSAEQMSEGEPARRVIQCSRSRSSLADLV